MKVNSITNQNFYGYKNVLTGNNISLGDKKISFVSMQLNDVGFEDLKKYLELRKMQGLPEGCIDEDILTFSYITGSKGNNMYLGNTRKPMYWGEELVQLEEKFVPKLMSEAEFEKVKKAHMRAYTLLAQITERMMNDNSVKSEDKEMYKVYNSLVKSLSYILGTERIAFDVATVGRLVKFPYQKIAARFNKGINITMKNFLIRA